MQISPMSNFLIKILTCVFILFTYGNLYSQSHDVYNTCLNKTVNLTTHIQAPINYGTIVSWHTALPATNANKVTNPSSVGVGTYYAIFLDTINNCYAGNGYTATTVNVKINPDPSKPVLPLQINNICPEKSANLSNISGRISPSVSGSSFEWHIGNSPTSSLIENPNAVISGTYYLFEKSPSNCYSEGAPIQVMIQDCCPTTNCPPLIVKRLKYIQPNS